MDFNIYIAGLETRSVMSSSLQPHGQARILERVAISSSRDLPDSRIEPGSPALQVDSLPSELPGKPSFFLAIPEWDLNSSDTGNISPSHTTCLTPHSDSPLPELSLELSSTNCVCAQSHSYVWVFVTPWAVVSQAPLFMGFSRQGYRSRLSFPTPGGLPDPRIKPTSPASPAWAGRFFTTAPPGWLTWLWWGWITNCTQDQSPPRVPKSSRHTPTITKAPGKETSGLPFSLNLEKEI